MTFVFLQSVLVAVLGKTHSARSRPQAKTASRALRVLPKSCKNRTFRMRAPTSKAGASSSPSGFLAMRRIRLVIRGNIGSDLRVGQGLAFRAPASSPRMTEFWRAQSLPGLRGRGAYARGESLQRAQLPMESQRHFLSHSRTMCKATHSGSGWALPCAAGCGTKLIAKNRNASL